MESVSIGSLGGSTLPPRSALAGLAHAVPVCLGAILGANIVTMSLMNFLELETSWILLMYLVSAILTVALVVRSGIRFPKLDPSEHAFSAALAVLFFLPRIMYLLEGALGYAVDPSHDDWAHIQYMAAIIDSPRFPPRSTYDNSKFLSYYYAPWILGAAFHQTGLLSTVKQALALTDFVYATFASYFVVFASKTLFCEKLLQRTFLVLCVFYGGFDFIYWLSGFNFTLMHAEWWATDFGIEVQYSNFFTLLLWVPQHVTATMAVLYSLYVVLRADGAAARILAAMLLTSAVFSSPFVVFGAIPLGIVLVVRNKLFRAVPLVLAVTTLLTLPLFWIFLGKDSGGFKYELEWFGELGSFLMQHKRAAFVVFVLVTSLELWPLLWASRVALVDRILNRWLVLASVSYLVSIFFVYYVGDNYCMRGAIIPIFTLAYVATPEFARIFCDAHRRRYLLVLFPYFLGGLYEYASFSASSLAALRNSRTPFNASALISNSGHSLLVDKSLLNEAKQHELGWYILEKRKPVPKEDLLAEEAATFHVDNHYRLTLKSIVDKIVHRYVSLRKGRGA